MGTFSLFQALDVNIYETDEWTYDAHSHSFFELIYILEGEGVHLINQNRYPYTANDLYFLLPGDGHSFEIKTRTRFCLFLFNKIYFSKDITSKHDIADFSEIFKRIEYILQNANFLHQHLFEERTERLFMENLITNIVEEHQKKE